VVARQIPGAKYVELPGDEHLIGAGDVDAVVDEVEEFLTGRRPVHEPDRVLATVLFTDIVGSTEKATEVGDGRWRALLDQHHSLVRRQLERFHGREVDTAGDGSSRPSTARPERSGAPTRCEWGSERSASRSVQGCTLANARSWATACAGARCTRAPASLRWPVPARVLVSSTVRDLVAGSGIEFEDRGTHELKGIPGEWRLYAVSDA
jgi:class 3 adenylate cyclase